MEIMRKQITGETENGDNEETTLTFFKLTSSAKSSTFFFSSWRRSLFIDNFSSSISSSLLVNVSCSAI